MVDWELIKKLIQTVKEVDISGLAIEEKGIKYEVKRDRSGNITHAIPAPAVPVAQLPVVPNSSPAAPADEAENKDLIAITSPMVGTFYRSPSPESAAFVEVGDSVEQGKVVCIIEAMKLFNEIEAEVRGKVVKILVESGQPVEYGQKLMLISKA